MAKSFIEWTHSTWNPTTGCSKQSAGCQNCYAEVMAKRLNGMGLEKYKNGFQLTVHPDTLLEPFKWKKPRVIFVNSMSDLFHEDMPLEYIQKVFSVMNECNHHIFQILTKRAENLFKFSPYLKWTENIWMGVTVENVQTKYRMDYLRKIPASIKFLSMEPLLGPVGAMNLTGIDWVIAGGESGNRARPVEEEWVIDIKDQCERNQTAFFFKQWGGRNKKKSGRLLQGQTYSEMPALSRQLAMIG